jgi:Glu-tRNA(Gln) amidotransferase subunit E-like FAD-binding protein
MFVSNCNPERLRFITELSKYIKIHSYGGCLHSPDLPVFNNFKKKI